MLLIIYFSAYVLGRHQGPCLPFPLCVFKSERLEEWNRNVRIDLINFYTLPLTSSLTGDGTMVGWVHTQKQGGSKKILTLHIKGLISAEIRLCSFGSFFLLARHAVNLLNRLLLWFRKEFFFWWLWEELLQEIMICQSYNTEHTTLSSIILGVSLNKLDFCYVLQLSRCTSLSQ